jgi:hypothetical protein
MSGSRHPHSINLSAPWRKMRLVLLRKASPCSPFLRRCHPGGPSQRLGLHHTHLAHIGMDRCAIDVRRFTAGCLTRILVSVIWLGQHRTRGGDEDQYEQCSFHPGLSLRVAACAPTASVERFRFGRRKLGVPLSPECRNAFGSPNTSPATPVSAAAAKQQQ